MRRFRQADPKQQRQIHHTDSHEAAVGLCGTPSSRLSSPPPLVFRSDAPPLSAPLTFLLGVKPRACQVIGFGCPTSREPLPCDAGARYRGVGGGEGGVRCHMSSVVMIPHQMRCTRLPAVRPCPMWPLSLDLSASGWGSSVRMRPPTCWPTSPPPAHVHHALRRTPACSCGLNKRVFTTSERETWGSGRKPGSNCFQAGLRVHEHERSARPVCGRHRPLSAYFMFPRGLCEAPDIIEQR